MTQYVKYNQVLRSGTTSISRFSLDLIRRQRRYVSRSMYVCMYVCMKSASLCIYGHSRVENLDMFMCIFMNFVATVCVSCMYVCM